MNPFFFGNPDSPLFGMYHPPRGSGRATRGAVLCYPTGAEYMRAHPGFRELTSLLTERGIHVLRFDYFGTGDSAGRGDEGTVERWLDDIGTAVDELKATTGIAEVSLVGLRFGGTLAAIHSARRNDLDRVVLCDPVVHGATHVTRLMAPLQGAVSAAAYRPEPPGFPIPGGAGVAAAARRVATSPRIASSRWTVPAPPGTANIDGFPLTRRMRDSIARIDLAERRFFGGRALHLVVSREELHFFRLRDRWRALNRPHGYRCIRAERAAPMDRNRRPGAALAPADVSTDLLEGVVACLA